MRVASPKAPLQEPEWIESPHPAAERGAAALANAPNRATNGRTIVANAARRLLYWPDADMRWALSTARRISASIREFEKPDWIITSSPPESAHLAGALIKQRTGIRWLAEMRDSWIDEPLREELRTSVVRRSIERRIATTLLRRADHIVAVSASIAAEAKGFGIARPISLIGHFADSVDETRTLDGPGPHLVHTGQFSLSHPERTLDAVLDAFERVLPSFPTAMLHLVGRLTHEEIQLAARHATHNHTKIYGPLPYADARAFQRGADGLVLYQPDTAALPGKISEYLLCDAPILIVGDGAWQERLEHVPHWRMDRLTDALAAPRRTPTDLLNDALNRYESVLLEPDVALRGGSI